MKGRYIWRKAELGVEASRVEDRIIVHIVIVDVEWYVWEGVRMAPESWVTSRIEGVAQQVGISIRIVRNDNTRGSSRLNLRGEFSRSLT